MTNYERKNRIREALAVRNMKQVELSEKTGIAKGTINNWLNQRYQPKQKSLMTMAKALDVSEMWLAGYDVPMERPVAQKKSDELTQLIFKLKEDIDLQNLFISISHLNSEQRKTIESMVNELTKLNTLH